MLQLLRDEHELLRTKIDALAFVIEGGQEAAPVIRNLCFSLNRRLDDHIQHEQHLFEEHAELLANTTGATGPQYHHDVEALDLAAATQQLIHHDHAMSPTLEMFLKDWMVRLRNGMDRQECVVFDVLELTDVFGELEPFREVVWVGGLCSDWTVNTVLELYPQTRPIVERYGVQLTCEGYERLEEVAWRRGVDRATLLLELARAINDSPLPLDPL